MTSESSKRALPEVDVLWYATQPLAPTYRAIIEAFAAAERDEFTLELSEPEVLRTVLDGPYLVKVEGADELRIRLDDLYAHGNLNRRQDERATSLEDLIHRRYLWSLTSAGRTAHRAIEQIEATLGQPGSLQVTMLTAVRESLRELTGGGLPANQLYLTFNRLFTAQEQFTEEAQRYITRVTSQHLQDGGVDEEEFRIRKEAVKLYLSRFVSQLAVLAPEIEEAVRRLDGHPIGRLIEAGSTADDIPPADVASDPAADWRARQHLHWQGLARWYVPGAGRPPTVDRLRAVTLEAVMALTRALTRLNAARTGAPPRRAAFL
jgi:uncharacterized protein (TIGR02677 family)